LSCTEIYQGKDGSALIEGAVEKMMIAEEENVVIYRSGNEYRNCACNELISYKDKFLVEAVHKLLAILGRKLQSVVQATMHLIVEHVVNIFGWHATTLLNKCSSVGHVADRAIKYFRL
jgi:hypothetical protein